MIRRLAVAAGFASGVVLVVAALCGWQNADVMVVRWKMGGSTAVWGARCAAVGLGAAGQVILLSVIGRWVYRRDVVSDVLRLGGVLVVMLAGVTAVALAMAGRN